jgi:hypothetical protein
LTEAYRATTPRVRCDDNYKLPYWWNENVQILIKETRKKRRLFQKCHDENRGTLQLLYKTAKRELKYALVQSKKLAWDELCENLNGDVFGDAYKIAKKKLQVANPKSELALHEKRSIFEKLFITTRCEEIKKMVVQDSEYMGITVSEDEVRMAATRIKPGKAPGPDCLPAGVVKEVANRNAQYFAKLFSHLLREGEFPKQWKKAKLVLIDKPKKTPNEETKYRPICLLNVLAKLYESIINARLISEIARNGDFSPQQYGFRKGMTTMDAVQEIINIANESKSKRKWNALIMVDVKNAFNSAAWPNIISRMVEWKVSNYLINVIIDYFDHRSVQLEKGTNIEIGGGVPQGSVLGPTLWNILYNDIMSIQVPRGVKLICYADDLAISVVDSCQERMVERTNEAINMVAKWMKIQKLEIAPEKTVAIVFNRRIKDGQISFLCEGVNITPEREAKYLGVTIDTGLRFTGHIRAACAKSEKTVQAMKIIMPNTRGPRASRRKVLALAMQSTILYAAPVWHTALDKQVNKIKVASAQRSLALRVCSAYRTVSGDAAVVLAGLVPLHLLARERAEIYSQRDMDSPQLRKDIRRRTMTAWQQEWNSGVNGRWTWRLIREISPWIDRAHGEISFRMTQCMTGHGVFGKYLRRIRKAPSEECMYCGAEEDSPEHTLFVCPKWDEERCKVVRDIQLPRFPTPDTLIGEMLSRRDIWGRMAAFMEYIIRAKEVDEIDSQQVQAL